MQDLPRAFLVHGDALYFPKARSESNSPFSTPVTDLIEGICEQFPSQSIRILRSRIFTSTPLTPQCVGMIRVVAKRISVLPTAEYRAGFEAEKIKKQIPIAPQAFLGNACVSLQFAKDSEIIHFTQSLKKNSDRNISAVLTAQNRTLLAQAWNTNSVVRTEHAELKLIRSLIAEGKKSFPVNSKIWVSLKPCAMCAAAILAFSDSAHPPEIIYFEDDPGPKAKNSVLMRGSELWLKAGQPQMRLTGLQNYLETNSLLQFE